MWIWVDVGLAGDTPVFLETGTTPWLKPWAVYGASPESPPNLPGMLMKRCELMTRKSPSSLKE